LAIKSNSKLRNEVKKIAYKYAFLLAYGTDNHKLYFSPRFILRGITVPFRMKPNFLIVGAAKSGTTSLYNYLIQHEQILPAIKKFGFILKGTVIPLRINLGEKYNL